MRIRSAGLGRELDKGLAPFYLIFGPEILLVEEALDELRRHAREQGYGDRESHTVDRGFDWNLLFGASQSMSLFAEKKIVEIRMPTGRPGTPGSKALVEYCASPAPPDTLLIIISGAIDRNAQGSKWFKAVESAAAVVECPEVKRGELVNWLERRIRSRGFRAEQDAVVRLAHYVEGNLLAASQQINLLGLLAEDDLITADLVENTIADNARFDNFNFADACLAGAARRAVRVLASLRNEQAEPILILWALNREVRTLCQLAAIREQGGNPAAKFRNFGIWSAREAGFRAALNRLSLTQCQGLMRRLARADLQLKGQAPLERRDLWEEIESIGLGLCGVAIP